MFVGQVLCTGSELHLNECIYKALAPGDCTSAAVISCGKSSSQNTYVAIHAKSKLLLLVFIITDQPRCAENVQAFPAADQRY